MARRVPSNPGFILLAVWLIVSGLVALINLHFPGINAVLAVLAIAAGVLILLKR